MKNLQLISTSHCSVPDPGIADVFFTNDNDTGIFYVNTAKEILGMDLSKDEEKFSMSYDEMDKGEMTISGLQFLSGEESLCVSTKEGDLLLINIPSRTVECVGTVDSGLVAMAWSPDQELVLLGTGHGTVIAMTREFDPVAEVDLNAKEFGKGEFITVGWGKKETQFHGKEGKEAAKKKIENVEPAFSWDDRKIKMTWRGDGQYFAVSMIDPVDGNRKFRVWSRECILQYTSEYINGLESAFTWRPSGNLLASSQRKPHRHDIIFFEKNGLQHGEFTLPFGKDEVQVKQLEWNSDSSVLAIWLTNLPLEDDKKQITTHYLQLWTMSNYHWYLKQQMTFDLGRHPVSIQWDLEQAYKLHMILSSGRYQQYLFAKVVHDSTYPKMKTDLKKNEVEMENLSYVAVIDGKNVLMTPFKSMVVPPPMCAFKLLVPKPVNSVQFLISNERPNDIAVFMSNGQVAIFTTCQDRPDEEILQTLCTKLDAAGGNGFSPQVKPHTPSCLLSIEDNTGDLYDQNALHHWIWLDDYMLAIGPALVPQTDVLYLFEVCRQSSKLIVKNSVNLDSSILSAHVCAKNDVVLQTRDGKLLLCQVPMLSITDYTINGEALTLERPCISVSSCTFDETECVVALSEHSRLYINNTEVASDCSSFCLHNDFLFMTTHAHQLRCLNRKVPLEKVLKYFRTPLEGRSLLEACEIIETTRAVERGSKIVTVTPSDCRLVLQMPRGNLELIYPRCLVLSVIQKLFTSLKFGEAFAIMKRQRINMNLFYDVSPKLFEDNISNFIEGLKDTNSINIFIGSLQNEILTQTMYKQYFATSEKDEIERIPVESKVNGICDLLIKHMEKDEERYIMSLVTAHVKKSPSEVGRALLRIKDLSDKAKHDSQLVANVLKYMTVLVEGNKLFNEALGTYDFKLVMMVAEKSQLDPKEFMPILRELQSFEENYRRYRIDVKLRRYKSALKNIAKCKDHFEECLELIEKHELYRDALGVFTENSERHKTVCQAYGNFLNSKRNYEEAGLMFGRCGDMQQALECYINAGNCSLALSTAYKLKYSEDQLLELSYKLAEKAKSKGRHCEAVEIFEHHAKDIERAVEAALGGHLWHLASRITEQYQRQDLNETHIEPALLDAHEKFILSLESHEETLLKHSKRLEVVRQMKERQMREALLDGVEGTGMESDLYSDTSSTMAGSITSKSSSNVSRSTGRTSRSRRKRERKTYSLKEGGRFENLALLHSLKTTIKAVDGVIDDVRALCLHLMLFQQYEKAEKLQRSYDKVRGTASELIPTVWSVANVPATGPVSGPQSTVNSILASVRSGNPSGNFNEPEKQNFDDVELFLPPKFDKKTSWMFHVFENS